MYLVSGDVINEKLDSYNLPVNIKTFLLLSFVLF